MKKILSMILLAFAVLACVSCGGADVKIPDGMELASDTKINNWYFFVPSGWSVSESGGMCLAYVPTEKHTSVSFADFSAGGYETVADYWASGLDDLKNTFRTFEVVEDGGDTTLAGFAAKRYVYAGDYNGKPMKFLHVLMLRGGAIYSFTYSAEEDVYEKNYTYAERVLDEIKFRGQE